MKKFLMLTAAALLLSTAGASAQTIYQVSPGVSDGVLNIRKGPSPEYGLVGPMPAGAQVTVYRCVPPQVTYSKADWCEVYYAGMHGWASTSGMYPLQAAPPPPSRYIPPSKSYVEPTLAQESFPPTPPPPPPSSYTSVDWVCVPSVVVSSDDRNPVREILVHAEGTRKTLRRMLVTQVLLDGSQYDRSTQYSSNYNLFSDPEHDRYGWRGTYVRDPSVTMQGEFTTGNIYKETQFKNGVFAFSMTVPCHTG